MKKAFAASIILIILALTGCGNGLDSNSGSSDDPQHATRDDNGRLTLNAIMAWAKNPGYVAVDPSRRYAYVVNPAGNSVSQYFMGTGGTLLPMDKPAVAAGTEPVAVTVDRSGRYVYVVNHGGNSISQYVIGADGGLSPIGMSAVSAGSEPAAIAIEPSSRYVYVANYGSDTVSSYAVASDGSLSLTGTVRVTDGTKPVGINVDSSSRYVSVTCYENSMLSYYAIGADGILSPLDAAQFAAVEKDFAGMDLTRKKAGIAAAEVRALVPDAQVAAGGIPSSTDSATAREDTNSGSAKREARSSTY